MTQYGDQTANNRLLVYTDRVSLLSDYQFQGIELEYVEIGIGSNDHTDLLRFTSLLPPNFTVLNGTNNKAIILKMNHTTYDWFIGQEVELFTHNGNFEITKATLVTRELLSFNLYIDNHALLFHNWENTKREDSWDLLSSNWEDIKVDGRKHRLAWKKTRNFDSDTRTVTTTKELGNK